MTIPPRPIRPRPRRNILPEVHFVSLVEANNVVEAIAFTRTLSKPSLMAIARHLDMPVRNSISVRQLLANLDSYANGYYDDEDEEEEEYDDAAIPEAQREARTIAAEALEAIASTAFSTRAQRPQARVNRAGRVEFGENDETEKDVTLEELFQVLQSYPTDQVAAFIVRNYPPVRECIADLERNAKIAHDLLETACHLLDARKIPMPEDLNAHWQTCRDVKKWAVEREIAQLQEHVESGEAARLRIAELSGVNPADTEALGKVQRRIIIRRPRKP